MSKRMLATIATTLFIIVVGGLVWLATQQSNTVGALLSYTAGLSMIFLPCTLPLAFVIVPMAAREEDASRGVGLGVAFAFGLVVTLMAYGVVTAFLGGYFGLDQITRVMFVVAGLMALGFGLTELGLFHIPLPTVTHRVPNWISEGYGKSFLLGIFLGNAGIGCPNPAFYVLLTYIASTGDVFVGGWLGLVHGLGRATPLLLLVILALIGIKFTDYLQSISKQLNTWTGTALVAVGSFILTYGLFGMHWWEDSIFHAGWNSVMYTISPALAEAPNHPVAEGVFTAPSVVGWSGLVLFMLIPLVWYKVKCGMNRARFWLFAGILVLLLALSVSGLIVVEHGHGVKAESDTASSTHETAPVHPEHEHSH